MKLTDFLNSINHTKDDLFSDDDEYAEKLYQGFVVNRSLSYFPDTVFHANEMNIDNMDAIKEYFNYSNSKAQEALKVLSEDDISEIKDMMQTGGVK